MKIKGEFVLSEIGGEVIAVSIANEKGDFDGMINLTETGAFLWRLLEKDVTEDLLVKELLTNYNVDEQTAKLDVKEFINKLKEKDLLI